MQPLELQNVICKYLRSYGALYGTEAMTPKFHMAFHLPRVLERFGFLPSCFCLERKHKVPKKFGNQVRNTSSAWDAGVLRDITAEHIGFFVQCDGLASPMPHLVKPRQPTKGLMQALRSEPRFAAVLLGLQPEEISTARKARINEHETCAVHDVVVVVSADGAESIGQIGLMLDIAGVLVIIIQKWMITSTSKRHWKCTVSSDWAACAPTDISGTCIWGGEAVRTVLKPFRM